jgi:hypothetical protein
LRRVAMTDQAKEARNAYYRKYRAEHKEQQREIKRKYWEKRAAKLALEKEVQNAAENEND